MEEQLDLVVELRVLVLELRELEHTGLVAEHTGLVAEHKGLVAEQDLVAMELLLDVLDSSCHEHVFYSSVSCLALCILMVVVRSMRAVQGLRGHRL